MNAPAPERRFVCPDCKHVHFTWAARCAGCSSLAGLVLVTGTDVDRNPPAQPPPDLDAPQEFIRFARPRLSIARLSPQPELTDPSEELVDPGLTASGRGPVLLSEVSETLFKRDSTGLPPLDHVLGGGLVRASVVLLASPPGIGKTTLSLQMLDGLRHQALYVTGEETEGQVATTARRIGVALNRIYVFAERDLDSIFAHARALQVQTIAIDSIQKMACADVAGRAGAVAQLKECTARLVQYAKTTDTALWLIGHVTSDGDIQGPKTIEHDVDVVLELDRGPKFEGNERILNCSNKNRFGPTGNVVGRFELTPKGFVPVDADGWDEKL
jgi:predicted ATP-dependent serine protease